MAILDSNGNPLGSVSEEGDNSSYMPQNMVVIGGLIHKISNSPVFTFQIIIPFEKFAYYIKNPNTFTRFVNHTAAYAYGASKLGKSPEELASTETLVQILTEISDKYNMSLSEPLSVDYILKDTTNTASLDEEINEEERTTEHGLTN